MKYLKHKETYRAVLAIEDAIERMSIVREMTPGFQDFYEKMAIHKVNKLTRFTELYIKRFRGGNNG
jgi:hypothetical protein